MATILCIDDSIHGLTVRRHLFAERGWETVTARSGKEGLEKFKSEKIDLAVVDYVMPESNGGEVIRALRKLSPRLPIVLLSGYAETLALHTKVPEADAVLHKGRSREAKDLADTVERLLRRRWKKPAGKAPRIQRPKAGVRAAAAKSRVAKRRA